jgi:hypothetical protein
MDIWELKPKGSLWMKATVTLLRGSIIREAGHAAFSVIPWHFPYN